MSEKRPYVCEPTDQTKGRPATLIFLHGYGDDAEGLPLGLSQQFQFNSKLPYLRWLLPNAPHNREAGTRAWYLPKALPNAMKPQVPGQAEEDETAADDEAGILASVDVVDQLVQGEIDRGVDPERIVVGGFSQGCAVSLIWGLAGRMRTKAAGVMLLSGYFPLADRVEALRRKREVSNDEDRKKWFYVHGTKDMMVPSRMFAQGKEHLSQWVDKGNLEDHLYEGMSHSTCNPELRDMLFWLNRVVPA